MFNRNKTNFSFKFNKTLLVLFIIILITGCSLNSNNNVNENDNNLNGETEKIEMIEYYKDNEMINKYLNSFNKLYPTHKITNDMLSVYHHHGSDHKDQVQFYMEDKQITLTGGTYTNTISIYIDNLKSDNDDIIKELTIMFTKAINNNLSENQIAKYWDLQKESDTNINTYGNIEYWSNKYISKDIFEYIKISGEI